MRTPGQQSSKGPPFRLSVDRLTLTPWPRIQGEPDSEDLGPGAGRQCEKEGGLKIDFEARVEAMRLKELPQRERVKRRAKATAFEDEEAGRKDQKKSDDVTWSGGSLGWLGRENVSRRAVILTTVPLSALTGAPSFLTCSADPDCTAPLGPEPPRRH